MGEEGQLSASAVQQLCHAGPQLVRRERHPQDGHVGGEVRFHFRSGAAGLVRATLDAAPASYAGNTACPSLRTVPTTSWTRAGSWSATRPGETPGSGRVAGAERVGLEPSAQSTPLVRPVRRRGLLRPPLSELMQGPSLLSYLPGAFLCVYPRRRGVPLRRRDSASCLRRSAAWRLRSGLARVWYPILYSI